MKPSYTQNQPESIKELFGSIAKRYDRTNALQSFQLNRWWNHKLIEKVLNPPELPPVILDLCAGTGEIALRALKRCPNPRKAYLLDFCPQMLDCARVKAKSLSLDYHEIDYLTADAQAIPLPENSVDCATIAYGIRNVKDPAQCIQDTFRVLKPGGRFGILELTVPGNPLLRGGHWLYLENSFTGLREISNR